MVKNDKWYLMRCKVGGQFYLNVGVTKIGRNKEADVITKSNICSRSHCIITLHPDDSIWITNKVNILEISPTLFFLLFEIFAFFSEVTEWRLC